MNKYIKDEPYKVTYEDGSEEWVVDTFYEAVIGVGVSKEEAIKSAEEALKVYTDYLKEKRK